jgi:hypothetical protein
MREMFTINQVAYGHDELDLAYVYGYAWSIFHRFYQRFSSYITSAQASHQAKGWPALSGGYLPAYRIVVDVEASEAMIEEMKAFADGRTR